MEKASTTRVLYMLKNPAYAGTYAYGRSKGVCVGPAVFKKTIKRLPADEWAVMIHNKYPAYIAWETYQKIQAMLRDNHAEYDYKKSRGIARPGSCLVQGMVYCGDNTKHRFVNIFQHTAWIAMLWTLSLKHSPALSSMLTSKRLPHKEKLTTGSRDSLQVRIVWKGHDTTTIPIWD